MVKASKYLSTYFKYIRESINRNTLLYSTIISFIIVFLSSLDFNSYISTFSSSSTHKHFYAIAFSLFTLLTWSTNIIISKIANNNVALLKHYQLFFFAFTLIIAKNLARIYFSDIWAEDGRVFLQEQFHSGISVIFKPYAGYFHTAPRILTLFTVLFPAKYIPFVISLLCYSIYAFIIIEITKKSYRHIIENDKTRLLLIILWCSVPGINEVLGNFTNLHWILLAYLAIISIKNTKSNYNTFDIAAAFLTASSEGAAIILIPVYLTRIIIKLYDNYKIKAIVGELAICLFILFFTILNFAIIESKTSTNISYAQFEVWYKNFTAMFIAAPLIGDLLTFKILENQFIFIFLSLITIAALAHFINKSKYYKNLLMIVFWGTISLLPVMISMARSPCTIILTSFFNLNEIWWNFRYSFFLPFFGYLFWVWFASQQKNKLIRNIILSALLFTSILINHKRFFSTPLGHERHWVSQSEKIDSIRKGKLNETIIIPIHPQGWKIEINPKNK